MKKMKKAIALFLSVLMACSLLGASALAAGESIGVREAARIALADVGISYDQFASEHMLPFLSDVTMRENFDAGIIQGYEVSFVYRGVSYDYSFLPDGTVTAKTTGSVLPAVTGGTSIPEDVAKQLAVAYVGYPDAADQAKNWDIHTELDDGRYICEVEFLFDARSARVSEPNAIYEFEYDLEIDCATGEVLSASWDDNTSSFLNLLTDLFNKIIIFFRQIFGVFA